MSKKSRTRKGRSSKARQAVKAMATITQGTRRIPAGPEVVADRTWYLVQTKPGQDARAARNLTETGFVVFRPTYARKITSANPRKARGAPREVVRSLFPGYLFLSPQTCRLDAAHGLDGVGHLVTSDGAPAVIPAPAIARVIAYLAAPEADTAPMRIGDVVTITYGALAGHSVILEADAMGRVSGRIELFGKRFKIPLASLGETGQKSCAA